MIVTQSFELKIGTKSALEYFTVRDDQSVAFRVIPELAVMPRKRFWSGQITQGEILAVLKRYRPEQLLLDETDLADEEMARFVSDNYTLVSQDVGLALFEVADSRGRLGGESAPKP